MDRKGAVYGQNHRGMPDGNSPDTDCHGRNHLRAGHPDTRVAGYLGGEAGLMELILGRRSTSGRSIGFGQQNGSEAGELVTYSKDAHLVTFAPTGGGKTSGPVICNALTHRGQLIVIDIKGEIYKATAKARRKMGQEIHVLDMRDKDPLPGSLNPLDLLVMSGTDHAAIARGFAGELIERGDGEKDRFWNDWAETVIAAGLTWMLADKPKEERRLSGVFDLFTDYEADYKIAALLDVPDAIKNKAARAAFASYLRLPGENTRGGVLGTVVTHLRLFDSEMIRRLTDTSSMDVEALVRGKPMTLYIIVPPERLTAYRPVLRMWISSLILGMTQRRVLPKERTLMLCDEMGNLGKVDALVTAATLMRSWGLTLWCFLQSPAQLAIYKEQATTLVDNAGVIQTFGAKNQRMAQDFANIVGGISAEQIMKMRPDEQLLLIDGKILPCKQVRYYDDALFQTRESRNRV
jgi:type IV secretion system protein VirD4